jgi:putative ABC transport system ATP-binding protein
VPASKDLTVAEIVISVNEVHKSYRRGANVTKVLSGINLSIDRGQLAFLVGPSGSGKSTLLSILGCILTPDSGEVRLFGQETSRFSNAEMILMRRQRIGFCFQRFHLIRGLTAFDNVMVPMRLCGAPERQAKRRVLDLLAKVGLADKGNERPSNLSAGQCQRIAIARALAADPDLILADEPTASLDAVSGQETMKLLQDLINEQAKTAIVVTHDVRIFHFADRICTIEKGVLREQAPAGTGVEREPAPTNPKEVPVFPADAVSGGDKPFGLSLEQPTEIPPL